jgi:hypothetical protein
VLETGITVGRTIYWDNGVNTSIDGFDNVDWFQMAQNRVPWWTSVFSVLHFGFLYQKVGMRLRILSHLKVWLNVGF